jgi:hypothetical protein
MFWTKRLPTVDGWYWWRENAEQQSLNIVGAGMTWVHSGCAAWNGCRVPVERIGGEWYGPLIPPTGEVV